MSQEEIIVPKGWELKKLGDPDVSEIIMGQSPPSSTYNTEQNGLPFFQGKKDFGDKFPTTRTWCNKPKKIAKKGDILISVRAPVGSTNWAKEECCIGRGLSAIRVKIEPEYVYYFIKSLEYKLSKSGTGSVFNSISKDFLFQIQIQVPDTSTQKQIVAKLDHILEELKIKKKEILAIIEQNKKRIDFFEKNWMSYVIDREIEKHPQREKWELKKLSEVCQYISSGGTPNRSNSEYYGGDIPWLKIGDLNNGVITNSNEKITQEGLENSSAKLFPINTVLFAMYGATIGKTGILEKQCATNQAICGMVGGDKLKPTFLLYFLQSKYYEIRKMAEGAAQPNINQNKLKNFEIPLPSFQIQKQITQNIKSAEQKFQTQKKQFENIKNNYESKIKYINHIQSSVLDSAFSGKLLN